MRILTSLWPYYALRICSILALAGCVAPPPLPRLTPYPPFTCGSFTESYWQEFAFGVKTDETVDDIVATIVKLWDLDNARVQIESMSEKSVVIQWQVEFHDGTEPRYTAHFHKELKLTSIFFKWWDRIPTLAQVIECLGIPEHYAAYYDRSAGGRALYVDLWYVNRGFVLQGFSTHRQDQPPAIRPEYQIQNFRATLPGDLEQMLFTMYDPRPDVFAGFVCLIKPWPGSIEEMEVDSLLGPDPRCTLG